MNRELIFGLDIGTRTVIGMIGYKEKEKWYITDSVCLEHEQRAMLDGQIHDVKKVATIVKRVKGILEERQGERLTKVAIAAAGRALETQSIQVEHELEEPRQITGLDIQNLELLGIEEAKKLLGKNKSKEDKDYYCVAYSVTQYYLDDYVLSNLEGHHGAKMSAQVLATFLPKTVIESLYTVTERAGLEVSHLTLEPIAAMNAIIPEHLRLLNLALVDVGAGTSDIAITKDGSVSAYGMIPSAGDKVTETIVHKYLVDFNTAEKIKQAVGTQEMIEFEDILGLPYTVSKEEILLCIEPTITALAEQITKNILELNGKVPPNAVFCVGGGSQMAGLVEQVAKGLELPVQRVGVRNMSHVQNIELDEAMSRGPEMITPTGICMTAYENSAKQWLHIEINDTPIRLMNNRKLTLFDALSEYGVTREMLFPKHGKTLMFKLNGERLRVRGELGQNAVVTRYGEVVTLDHVIKDEDVIQFESSKDGADASCTLSDYIEESAYKQIWINDTMIELPLIFLNGDILQTKEYTICQNDQLDISIIETIDELFEKFEIELQGEGIYVNNEEVSGDYLLKDNDQITYVYQKAPQGSRSVIEEIKRLEAQQVKEELKETKEVPQAVEVAPVEKRGGLPIQVEVNGQKLYLEPKATPYLFADLFERIDFDLKAPKGIVRLLLNGREASVMDTIKEGDSIKIFWEN